MSAMYQTLADLLVLAHLAFVVFVIIGGWLALRWRWLAWVHLPCAAWGAAIEFGGWICPLTPLENTLRAAAGEAAYAGDFVEHYVMPLLYPAALTREIQFALGAIVIAINLVAYGILWRRWRAH